MAGLVGVLGGTFDPPHIGHLILADEARGEFSLDEVLWVLTPIPPHKPSHSITPLEYRLEMVLKAIEGNPAFQLSHADIDREPPHYAVGTMHWLRERFPHHGYVYLMGSDSLRDMPTWYQPHKFVELCDWIGVLNRGNAEVDLKAAEMKIPGIFEKVRFLGGPEVDISGSEIRRRVRIGKPYHYLVPHGVADIIQRHHLYLG
jgi:nicotinate-nucleotide adenylyltransferase